MSSLPPSGSRTIPTRARKSSSGVPGGFGSALKMGVDNVNDPNFSAEQKKAKKPPQIRIARQTYTSLIAAKALRMALVALFFLILVYVAFAVTVLRVIPAVSVGPVITKNITFPGGLIPSGELVVIDAAQPRGTDTLDYLEQATLPNNNIAIMRVFAGPWGTFDWESTGTVTYNGSILPLEIPAAVNDEGAPLDFPDTPRGDTNLQDEYLMVCVEGACVPGRGYIYSSGHILGQPIGRG